MLQYLCQARMRMASAAFFASAALFSNEAAMSDNFVKLLWLMCDFSALFIAFCKFVNVTRGQGLRTRQLVDVGFRHHQLCRPLDFLLILHVQFVDHDRLGGVDFILRQKLRRSQL